MVMTTVNYRSLSEVVCIGETTDGGASRSMGALGLDLGQAVVRGSRDRKLFA